MEYIDYSIIEKTKDKTSYQLNVIYDGIMYTTKKMNNEEFDSNVIDDIRAFLEMIKTGLKSNGDNRDNWSLTNTYFKLKANDRTILFLNVEHKTFDGSRIADPPKFIVETNFEFILKAKNGMSNQQERTNNILITKLLSKIDYFISLKEGELGRI